jgi:hypothetical protein
MQRIIFVLSCVTVALCIPYRGFVVGSIQDNQNASNRLPATGWGGCRHEPQLSGGTVFNATLEPFPGATLATIVLQFRHSYELDLAIFLRSPNGQVLPLTINNGNEGSHSTDSFIVFQDNANQTIVGANPPFNGAYRPDGRLISVCKDFYNLSGNIQTIGDFLPEQIGIWTLIVFDDSPGDTGLLLQWQLIFGIGS